MAWSTASVHDDSPFTTMGVLPRRQSVVPKTASIRKYGRATMEAWLAQASPFTTMEGYVGVFERRLESKPSRMERGNRLRHTRNDESRWGCWLGSGFGRPSAFPPPSLAAPSARSHKKGGEKAPFSSFEYVRFAYVLHFAKWLVTPFPRPASRFPTRLPHLRPPTAPSRRAFSRRRRAARCSRRR